MTKDEYSAYLEERSARLYEEVQLLIYEKGFLQGRLKAIIQRYPRLGMDIRKGGKYKELLQKGGEV